MDQAKDTSTTTKALKEKPQWATGDPFFDTMAGMDTPEYRMYHQSLSPNLPAAGSNTPNSIATTTGDLESSPSQAPSPSLEAAAAAMVLNQEEIDSNNAAAAQASSLPAGGTADIGIDHWNRTREQWTGGRWHVVQSPNSQNPALTAIRPGNHDAIYDSLVYDRKRLAKPIPLPLVIKVLVSGWKRDGLWQESPAQPPAPPGVNAYVPGFSSTNSQPLQKKL